MGGEEEMWMGEEQGEGEEETYTQKQIHIHIGIYSTQAFIRPGKLEYYTHRQGKLGALHAHSERQQLSLYLPVSNTNHFKCPHH